jgi:hypothetical protein
MLPSSGYLDERGSKRLYKAGKLIPDNTAQHPKTQSSSSRHASHRHQKPPVFDNETSSSDRFISISINYKVFSAGMQLM